MATGGINGVWGKLIFKFGLLICILRLCFLYPMDFSYQLSLTPRLLGWNALALKCIQFPDNEDFCEEAKLASLQCRLQLLGIELRIIVAVNSSLSQSIVHCRSQQFIVAVNSLLSQSTATLRNWADSLSQSTVYLQPVTQCLHIGSCSQKVLFEQCSQAIEMVLSNVRMIIPKELT